MANESRWNSEGTIFKRIINNSEYWVCKYKIREKTYTEYSKSRKEANKKLERIITMKNTNRLLNKSEKITLSQFTKNYIDELFQLNKLTETSYDRKLGYAKIIENHYIGNMKISDIQESDIKDFLKSITHYSNSVIKHTYGLLHTVFKRAFKKQLISIDYMSDELEFSRPKSDKQTKKVRGFTVEEQKKFIECIQKYGCKYKTEFLLSLFTGMRMGEVLGLYKKDIDMDAKIIHVRRTITRDRNGKTIMGNFTKTPASIRDIIINDQVEYILKDYLENEYNKNKNGLLFYNPKNTYYSTSECNMVFKRFCQKYNIALGYDCNQHQLRHTFATRCIEAGTPAKVIQKLMGHSTIRTTLDNYADVFANFEKKNLDKTNEYLKANGITIINENFPDNG